MAVAKELRKLTNEPLEGIKVLLNEEDITNIVADSAGPGARRARTGAPGPAMSATMLVMGEGLHTSKSPRLPYE